ncbi:MAG: GHKL domain-containing protein [Eubacterium sp.]
MIFFRLFLGYLLQMIPFAYLCCYPFLNYLRYSKRKTLGITLLLFLTLGTLFSGGSCYLFTLFSARDASNIHASFSVSNLIFMGCLIPCFFWYAFSIKAIWQKKLFIFFFCMTAALALTSTANIIEMYLYPTSDMGGLPYRGNALFTIASVTAIALPLLWLLLKYAYLPVEESLGSKESGYLSILSVLLFIILGSGLIFSNYERMNDPLLLFFYCALMVTVFVIYFVCFKLFFHTHEKLVAEQNLVQIAHQLEMNEAQYKRISDNIENSRKMRHDLRHHFLVLQGLLSTQKNAEALQYLEQFTPSLDDSAVIKWCNNTVVNMVLSHYKTLAEEKKITFNTRVTLSEEITVQDSDISVLLGNLLENAITAAARAPKENRLINLNIIRSGKMIAITADNGFDGKIKPENGRFLSIKPHHTGIGLQSIESIAKKYSGGVEFDTTTENGGFIFHASVMLKMD